MIAYGDAESHLNISKRVVHSLTPGMAQLGGIWLPLPHLFLAPLVYFDFLWRSGLAGSIVSGICYVITSIYIFKLIYLLTHTLLPSFLGTLVFCLNPNILYLQSTAMTELPLIALFTLSTYFLAEYLLDDTKLLSLIKAAFFGLLSTLTRYDGWFLVVFESFTLFFYYGYLFIKTHQSELKQKLLGLVILFSTLAFFGIGLWILWDWLVLGDPLYFTTSPFSAKSQQQGWLARNELPTYHNLPLSFEYYSQTFTENSGLILTVAACLGLTLFLASRRGFIKWLIVLLTLVPFIFYVFTLYIGQSVIFIPNLTPDSFEWQLFNVRYGVVMIPTVAIFFGYLLAFINRIEWHLLLVVVLSTQLFLFYSGNVQAISRLDGISGLSASKRTDAENWLKNNYDGGLVLVDDFARTVSLIRSFIPMQNTIYIGNKPYWEESLAEPEKHAQWIILQENDTLWNTFYNTQEKQQRLFTYYQKTYTSPTILIFKRNPDYIP